MSRMQPRGGNRQNSETVEKTSVVVVAPSKFSNSGTYIRHGKNILHGKKQIFVWEGPRGHTPFGITVKHKKWFKTMTFEKRPRIRGGIAERENPKPGAGVIPAWPKLPPFPSN